MSDTKKTFTLEIREDGVAVITMDVPGEPVNTLKDSFTDEFSGIFDEQEKNSAVKAIVFRSGKPNNFLAGAHITML
jgi:3-hydroxyacyl-CoA dehydrogenase/enoyl-CoA hydratase/3-hydroxybutyryl-CoA epimerase